MSPKLRKSLTWAVGLGVVVASWMVWSASHRAGAAASVGELVVTGLGWFAATFVAMLIVDFLTALTIGLSDRSKTTPKSLRNQSSEK